MKLKSKVLFMVQDADMQDALKKGLDPASYQTLFLSPGDVVQKTFDEVPHLVVIDEKFCWGEGRSLALALKEDAVLKYIPIILLIEEERDFYEESNRPIDFYFCKKNDIRHLLLSIQETIEKNYNELDLNPLTRFPGTRSTVLRLDRAMRADENFSLCCIDLTDLAAFNAAYGDVRGDQIITKLGDIIKEAVRESGSKAGFMGHLGGDDFLVLTESVLSVKVSERIILDFEKVIPRFYDASDRRQGYLLQRDGDGSLVRYPIMSVSIAIVEHEGKTNVLMSEISRIAGRLKKYMKTLPGSCYLKYRHQLDGGANEDSLEVHFPQRKESVRVPGVSVAREPFSDQVSAIIRGKKIRTVFQPLIELKSRRVVGYEALTRCLDQNDLSDPAVLFMRAREVGRTKELDKLCVDTALRSAQALGPDRKLFLNLNHETLIDPAVMRDLFSEKGAIGFKNIVIEITEQSILRSFERVKEALLELREQGVAVAIDDLGGGAVSLRDVAILKPDYIKFDRSLIRQINTNITKQQIILSMLLFANGIQATTAAEGIETGEEYDTVLRCGISIGQGFYIARPGEAFPEPSL